MILGGRGRIRVYRARSPDFEVDGEVVAHVQIRGLNISLKMVEVDIEYFGSKSHFIPKLIDRPRREKTVFQKLEGCAAGVDVKSTVCEYSAANRYENKQADNWQRKEATYPNKQS